MRKIGLKLDRKRYVIVRCDEWYVDSLICRKRVIYELKIIEDVIRVRESLKVRKWAVSVQ